MRLLRNLSFILSFLAVLVCTPPSFAASTEEMMLVQAKDHFSNGRYYFATTWLERILKNFPDSSHRREVLMLAAQGYARTGRDEKAVRHLRIIVTEYPEAAVVLEPIIRKLAPELAPIKAAAPPVTIASPTDKAATKIAATGPVAPASASPPKPGTDQPAQPSIALAAPPPPLPEQAATEAVTAAGHLPGEAAEAAPAPPAPASSMASVDPSPSAAAIIAEPPPAIPAVAQAKDTPIQAKEENKAVPPPAAKQAKEPTVPKQDEKPAPEQPAVAAIPAPPQEEKQPETPPVVTAADQAKEIPVPVQDEKTAEAPPVATAAVPPPLPEEKQAELPAVVTAAEPAKVTPVPVQDEKIAEAPPVATAAVPQPLPEEKQAEPPAVVTAAEPAKETPVLVQDEKKAEAPPATVVVPPPPPEEKQVEPPPVVTAAEPPKEIPVPVPDEKKTETPLVATAAVPPPPPEEKQVEPPPVVTAAEQPREIPVPVQDEKPADEKPAGVAAAPGQPQEEKQTEPPPVVTAAQAKEVNVPGIAEKPAELPQVALTAAPVPPLDQKQPEGGSITPIAVQLQGVIDALVAEKADSPPTATAVDGMQTLAEPAENNKAAEPPPATTGRAPLQNEEPPLAATAAIPAKEMPDPPAVDKLPPVSPLDASATQTPAIAPVSVPAPPAAVALGPFTLTADILSRAKTDRLLKKLKAAGLQPAVRQEKVSTEVYRLLSNCSTDRKAAERALGRIVSFSKDPFVIQQAGSHCVVAGSLFSASAAQQERHRLEKKGLQTEVVRMLVPLRVWRVSVGPCIGANDADKASEIIAAAGIDPGPPSVTSIIARASVATVVLSDEHPTTAAPRAEAIAHAAGSTVPGDHEAQEESPPADAAFAHAQETSEILQEEKQPEPPVIAATEPAMETAVPAKDEKPADLPAVATAPPPTPPQEEKKPEPSPVIAATEPANETAAPVKGDKPAELPAVATAPPPTPPQEDKKPEPLPVVAATEPAREAAAPAKDEKTTGGVVTAAPPETPQGAAAATETDEMAAPPIDGVPPSVVKPQLAATEAPAAQQASVPAPPAAVALAPFTVTAEAVSRLKIDRLLKKFKTAGLQSVVRQEKNDNTEVYRLISDCNVDRKAAERALAQVTALKKDPFLIVHDGYHCVVAGSLFTEEDARQEQQQLEKKGLQAEVVKMHVPLKVWRASVGPYTTAEDAEKALAIMRSEGFESKLPSATPVIAQATGPASPPKDEQKPEQLPVAMAAGQAPETTIPLEEKKQTEPPPVVAAAGHAPETTIPLKEEKQAEPPPVAAAAGQAPVDVSPPSTIKPEIAASQAPAAPPVPAAAVPAEMGSGPYRVTAEATNRSKVDQLLKMLKAAEMNPVVRLELKEKAEVYRLIANCTADRKAAEKARVSLAGTIREPFVVVHAGANCVVVGSFFSDSAARQGQQRLEKHGLQTEVAKMLIPLRVWHIGTGPFASPTDADRAAKIFLSAGIQPDPQPIIAAVAETTVPSKEETRESLPPAATAALQITEAAPTNTGTQAVQVAPVAAAVAQTPGMPDAATPVGLPAAVETPTTVTVNSPTTFASGTIPAPTAATRMGPYTVTAEAVSRIKVDGVLKKLAAAGLKPVVRQEMNEKTDVYRLVSTCTTDAKAAEKDRVQLSSRIKDPFVIMHAGAHCVVAGSLFSEDAAMHEQQRLQKKGLQTEVVKMHVPLKFWHISLGPYTSAEDAGKASELVSAAGLEPAVEDGAGER